MTPAARHLLLVRHGLPDYRARKAGDILPGPVLSETGWDQAHQAAAFLATYWPRPQALFVSPLTRAQQTAEPLGRALGLTPQTSTEIGEWQRTETLSSVGVRLTRWLMHWLRTMETCAVVVSHASPILALLRSALYLPHVPWHRAGVPETLELSSGDRFEIGMASVFELTIHSDSVTARERFQPTPRVLQAMHGRRQTRLPRPVAGSGANLLVTRPNWLALLGG